MDEFKSELSGNYEKVVLSLMKEPVELAIDTLYKAMKGAGTDENVSFPLCFHCWKVHKK